MIRLATSFAAATIVLLGLPAVAHAATFTVNATGAGYDGVCDANCTLRDAIDVANKSPGADTIVLGPAAYGAVQDWCNGGKRLDCGSMVITDDVTIQGAGAYITSVLIPENLIVASRIFEVNGDFTKPRVKVTLTNLAVRHGGGAQIAGGGMSMQHAEVTLRNVSFDGNVGSTGAALAVGNDSLLTMEHSSIINSHSYNGGAIDNAGQTVRLTNVTLSKNTSDSAIGGAIVNTNGAVFLNHVTAVRNLPGTLHSASGASSSQAVFQIKNSVLVATGNTNCTGMQFAGGVHLFQATYSAESGGSCGYGVDPAAASHNKWQIPAATLANASLVSSTWETPIPFHALPAGSPAVDGAEPATAATDDIRHKARPVDGNADGSALPDMGALEAQPTQTIAPQPRIIPQVRLTK